MWRRYRFAYEEADHRGTAELLKGVPCQVMVSGYPSTLYEERLRGWRSVEWQVMNQDGVRTEKLWFRGPCMTNECLYCLFPVDTLNAASHAGPRILNFGGVHGKAHPEEPRQLRLPPSQSPNDATARTRPGAKGKGPLQRGALRQHPHPRIRQGAQPMRARAAAKTSPIRETDSFSKGQR